MFIQDLCLGPKLLVQFQELHRQHMDNKIQKAVGDVQHYGAYTVDASQSLDYPN